MADMFIDRTSAALAKTLDGSALRQTVLADNIANVDTPGYTRKDITFEDQLRDITDRFDSDPDRQVDEISAMPLTVDNDETSPRRADGNNVDIEREMSLMAKNTLQYDVAADMLSSKYRMLQDAIHEGKR